MIRVIKTKICPVCHEPFPRPSGKSDKVWEKQVCCGTDCASINKRIDDPLRVRRIELKPGARRYQGRGKLK